MPIFYSKLPPTQTATASVASTKSAPVIPWYKRILSFPKVLYKRITRYWWAWEIFAAFLSIAATASLIGVLIYEDGREQKPFPFGSTTISLNTIVAALATVIRTSLAVAVAGPLNQSAWNWFASPRSSNKPQAGKPLSDLDTFGNASVDSLSSLKLIWKTKLRSLASVGAIIVVLSLAFDTFAQQVLGSRVQNVVNSVPNNGTGVSNSTDGSTALPRSQSYVNQYTGSVHTSEGIPLEAQGVVLSSIFTSNISIPQGICSTSNCTWPTTPTLGVCKSCSDIKHKITKSNITIPINSSENGTNYTQPAILYSIAVGNGGLASIEIAYRTEWDLNWQSNLSVISPVPYYNLFAPDRIMLAQYFMLGVPPTEEGTDDFLYKAYSNEVMHREVLENMMVAYNCSLYYCLQAYEAETINGVFQQNTSATWFKYTTSADSAGGDPLQSSFNVYTFADAPAYMNIANVSKYEVDESSLNVLAQFLANAIGGGANLTGNNAGVATFYNAANQGYGVTGTAPTTQALLLASTTLESMSAQAKQIADGFTSYMRTAIPAENDARYAPIAYSGKTYVHVRWPWLTYPLALLVTGLVFLCLTIWHTRRLRVRPWKGHRIPYLMATIPDDVRRSASGGLEHRNGLEERIGEVRLHLDYDNMYELAFKRAP